MVKKKSKRKLSSIIRFVLFGLGIATIVILFLPALGYADSDNTFTGMQVIFGYDMGSILGLAGGKINFNFLGLIALLLPIIASVVVLLNGNKKTMLLLCAILFLGGTILFFLLPTYTQITTSILGKDSVSVPDWSLCYGSIISGSLSAVGVLGSVYGYLS